MGTGIFCNACEPLPARSVILVSVMIFPSHMLFFVINAGSVRGIKNGKLEKKEQKNSRLVREIYFLAIVIYPEWLTLVDGRVPRFDRVISRSMSS